MKSVNTVVKDIYAMVTGAQAPITATAHDVSASYAKWHTPRDKKRESKVLYFSEVGDPCPRKLWFKYNTPEVQEKLEAPQLIKFFYGDLLEELVLNMAEDAGHSVTSKQEPLVYDVADGWIVRGRIDAVIDGAVVDVKSVTKFSEEKFKNGLVDDPFGYKAQLNGYASALDVKEAGFLTIQKELGNVGYYPINVDRGWFREQAQHAVEIVSETSYTTLAQIAPVKASKTNDNLKLGVSCSYCAYKHECWKDANDGKGIRTFVYSSGPDYLVRVTDTPRVMEVTDAS